MNDAVDEFKRARHRMAGDFRSIINDGEDMLKAAGSVTDESFAAARRKFEGKLKTARATLQDAAQPVLDTTRHAAATADGYVRGNAWAAVGIAMAAGALLGFLASKRQDPER